MSNRNVLTKRPQALDLNAIRRVMEGLCDIDDRVSRAATAEFRPELDAQRAVAIRTHAHHAARLARSILAIDEEFRGAEVIPNVRLLMECAVTAAWLLITPGSGHTLLRDGARKWKTALDLLHDLGEDTSPGREQAEKTIADLADAQGPRSYAFEQRCLALNEGIRIYSLYRIFSAESHAGMGISDFYVQNDDRSPIGISFSPHAENRARESTLGIAACMLALAINADELAAARPHHTTQIERAAKRLGVGVRIIGADGTELPPRQSP